MSATTTGNTEKELDWLLSEFVRGTPGVRHGLVVAGDGLRLAASHRVGVDLADHLSAVTSGLVSLAHNVAASFGAGPMRRTIVEMAGGYLFVTPVSDTSSLAVFAELDCDMGMVGYEMTLLADRVGHAVTPAARPAPEPADGPHEGAP